MKLLEIEQLLEEYPDNADYLELKKELEEAIAVLEPAVAESAPPPPPAEPAAPASASRDSPNPQEPEKWSKSKHPAFQPGYRKPGMPLSPSEETPIATFKVNDMVQAKWQKGFYPAQIRSITGSAAAPIYLVKYQGFSETANLRAHDIRPLTDSKKRKADGTQVSSSTSNTPTPSVATPPAGTISAAPSVNLGLVNQAKKEPMMATEGPPRAQKPPKKVKANKELEAKKNSWSAFQNSSKVGKGTKKDSMFRTGNSVKARGKPHFYPYITIKVAN